MAGISDKDWTFVNRSRRAMRAQRLAAVVVTALLGGAMLAAGMNARRLRDGYAAWRARIIGGIESEEKQLRAMPTATALERQLADRLLEHYALLKKAATTAILGLAAILAALMVQTAVSLAGQLFGASRLHGRYLRIVDALLEDRRRRGS